MYGGREDNAKWSPYIPLWRNPKLPELLSIPDFEFWPQKGIKYLTQLYHEGIFWSFGDLRLTLDLPHSAPYHYFQLWHACSIQFGRGEIQLECGPLESAARRVQLQKPVSSFYKTMLYQDFPAEEVFYKMEMRYS